MQTFKIKLPTKPKEVKPSNSEESNIIKEIVPEIELYKFEAIQYTYGEDFESDFDNFDTIDAVQTSKPKAKKKSERPVFSIFFSVKNMDKPVQLSLRKVQFLEYSQKELQEEIQAAYERGFQDGQQTTQMTLSEEFSKFEEWIRNIDQVTQELSSEFHKNFKELAKIIVPLSIQVARHILSTEVQHNPEILERQVQEALDIIDNEQIFEIRLNPEDIDILNSVKSRLAGSEPKLEGVRVVADSSIDRGGCIVETSVGRIDATFESQLKKIQENLENINLETGVENV